MAWLIEKMMVKDREKRPQTWKVVLHDLRLVRSRNLPDDPLPAEGQSTVRRSAKRPELPTAEELVGLPPKLQTTSDMMGEADETDTPMAGIEVGEDEVAAQKMLEQVGEMVKQSPDSAAKLLNRWIAVEP